MLHKARARIASERRSIEALPSDHVVRKRYHRRKVVLPLQNAGQRIYRVSYLPLPKGSGNKYIYPDFHTRSSRLTLSCMPKTLNATPTCVHWMNPKNRQNLDPLPIMARRADERQCPQPIISSTNIHGFGRKSEGIGNRTYFHRLCSLRASRRYGENSASCSGWM